MAQRGIKMDEEFEAIKLLNDNVENVSDELNKLNTLFEHYLVHVCGVRLPDEMQIVQEPVEH